MMYLSIDGDNIGNSLEKLILEEKENLLKNASFDIERAIKEIADYLVSEGFQMIICAGDNLLAKGKEINIRELRAVIDHHQQDTTFSVGIGDSLKEAYLALKYAKVTGKNRMINYCKGKFTFL